MKFNGTEVCQVLEAKGVEYLHHANSVTTSCNFLHVRGLASRGYVEKHGLVQTHQLTDGVDKRYGIWDDVFTDGCDVHYRGGKAKGPNQYGPVLFKLPVTALRSLPRGSVVMVTRKNPYHWKDGEPDSDRYFQDIDALKADPLAGGYRLGDFAQHIVVRSPSGILPFNVSPVEIDLDNPKRMLGATDIYAASCDKLRKAAKVSGLEVVIAPHKCKDGCLCLAIYAAADPAKMF